MVKNSRKPSKRFNNLHLRYGLEEIKFIRSKSDLQTFILKLAFYMPRFAGIYNINNPIPSCLQLEPTNVCNARCLSCSAWMSSRPRGYMKFSLFKKIIDDAAQIGVKRIRLFLHGEPLLHPQIIEMIAYLKTKGLSLNLTTNGIRLNKSCIEAILSSGVNFADQFTISVLGYSKDVHEEIMRGVNHEKVIANVLDFIEARRERRMNGPIIETIFYTMPQNEHEEVQYLNYWRGKVDHARLGGLISESFAKNNQQGVSFKPRTRTCLQIWERLTVFWNGDVTLCPEDVNGEWIFGNLDGQSINEIWNNEQFRSIKKIHKEKRFQEIPFCFQCDM